MVKALPAVERAWGQLKPDRGHGRDGLEDGVEEAEAEHR